MRPSLSVAVLLFLLVGGGLPGCGSSSDPCEGFGVRQAANYNIAMTVQTDECGGAITSQLGSTWSFSEKPSPFGDDNGRPYCSMSATGTYGDDDNMITSDTGGDIVAEDVHDKAYVSWVTNEGMWNETHVLLFRGDENKQLSGTYTVEAWQPQQE